MSAFESRWATWTDHKAIDHADSETDKRPEDELETGNQPTAKTAKRVFGSFGSAQNPQSRRLFEVTEERDLATATPPMPDPIAAMSLDEFATAGLVLLVESRLVGGRVLFVSDDVPDEKIGDEHLPAYRAWELKKLLAYPLNPKTLRTLNVAKTIFRAEGATVEILERTDAGDMCDACEERDARTTTDGVADVG